MVDSTTERRQPLTERQREWLEHVRAAERAGLELKEYAHRENLSVGAFYAARSVLRGKGWLAEPGAASAVTFAAVEVVEPQAPRGLSVHLPNGVRVDVSGPVNEATLAVVLQSAGALR